MVQIKVAQNLISYKKLSRNASLSTSGVELGDSKDLLFLKCYDTLERKSRFTSRLNMAKNTDYIKKWFKQKFCKIKFPTKN